MLSSGQKAESIIFIESGTVEVLTFFEGNEFVIDRLSTGSSINCRAYISSETLIVNFRVTKELKVLALMKEDMDKVKKNYAYGTKIGFYEAKLLKLDKRYHLDYLINDKKDPVKKTLEN